MNTQSLAYQLFNSIFFITEDAASGYLPEIIAYMKALENGHIELINKYEKEPLQVLAFSQGADIVSKNIDTAPAGSIAVIPIKGAFLKYGTMCAWGANEITPVMEKAAKSKNISAVVLDVDSGGGAENAVPPFHEAIKLIQKNRKPVVAHADMCASAAYYAIATSDFIVADNRISSAFGSIGCLIPYQDIRKKLEMEGIKMRYIYAPQSRMKNFESRELLENDNEEPLKENVLRPAADRFINYIKRARKNKINPDNNTIWEGAIFESDEIVKQGLADGFGTLREAIDIAAKLSNIH